MAILPQDDKQQQQGQNQNQNQGQDASSAGGVSDAGMGGGGGSAPTGASGAPAYGAGGSQGWTNIQSYLGANQGNTGSAQALSSQVGGAFDKENQSLQDQSSQAKTQGQSAVDSNNVGNDKASQLIQDAGSHYTYGAPQSDQYTQDTSQLKNALSATYGGPSSFNYAVGTDAQNYGQGLGTDPGFQGVMQGIYNKAGANPMGSGALALQNQLDTNNQSVNDARSALLGKYAGLNDNVTNTMANTNTALQGDQKAFGDNQTGLKSYLSGQGDVNKTAIDQRVAAIQDLLGNVTHSADVSNRGSWMSQTGQTPFSSHTALSGPAVTASNATGVDTQRNLFNTIGDVLGTNSTIQQSAPLNLADEKLVHSYSAPKLDLSDTDSVYNYLQGAHVSPYAPAGGTQAPTVGGKGPMKGPGDDSMDQYLAIAKSLGLA